MGATYSVTKMNPSICQEDSVRQPPQRYVPLSSTLTASYPMYSLEFGLQNDTVVFCMIQVRLADPWKKWQYASLGSQLAMPYTVNQNKSLAISSFRSDRLAAVNRYIAVLVSDPDSASTLLQPPDC